jgi:hypothetical protein
LVTSENGRAAARRADDEWFSKPSFDALPMAGSSLRNDLILWTLEVVASVREISFLGKHRKAMIETAAPSIGCGSPRSVRRQRAA